MNNIILLVADSLRADHLSCYGYEENHTPNIDWLASQGHFYKKAYSMGSNTPASLPHILSDYLLTKLKHLGYLPLLIHSNVNIALANLSLTQIDLYEKRKWRRIFNRLRAERINKAAHKILKQNFRRPLFLCLWYMDTHMPYLPPKSGLKALILNRKLKRAAITRKYESISKGDIENLIELYDGEVTHFDSCLGSFLKQIDLDTNTIILTSDHGEEFLEHGDLGHQNKDIPSLRHVPLIVSQPNISPIDDAFYFKDFDKTILRSIPKMPLASDICEKGELK